ncbi:hypothetical protein ACI2KT_37030, partial [Ensifer adhaerens]
HTPFTRYSATNGALASGFIIAELHQLMGHDRGKPLEAPGARRCGQADALVELRARVNSWPPHMCGSLRDLVSEVNILIMYQGWRSFGSPRFPNGPEWVSLPQRAG